MFVYCKDYCNRVRCFPDVFLRDGSVPQIGHDMHEEVNVKGPLGTSESVEMSLEPAIWFKVLLLDSISIDCAKRQILWTACSRCRLTGQDREWGFVYCSHVKHLYHTDGECYDYDADLDDIFDLAACLLTDKPDNKSLLRLLHCYILPMISLNSEDLGAAEEALKQEVISIERLDLKLNGQINQMTELKEFLVQKAKEFSAFLQGRDDIAYKTNREFLKVLIGFLPKIEEEKRENLSIYQEKVQDAKMAVQTCERDAALTLDDARSQRDEKHKELEEILTFRESMTHLVLIERDDWYELKSAEEDYISRCEEFENLKEEAKLTAEKKKRAVSVREALNDAVIDLRLGRETTGVDLSMLGERATDVLKRRSVPTMWQSLSERIAVLVNSDSHVLGREHRSFCNEVLKECQNCMDDDLLASNTSFDITAVLQLQRNSTSSVSSMGSAQQDVEYKNVQMGLQHNLADYLELDEQNENPFKKTVEKLCIKIQDHFRKVINIIQKEEHNDDQMFSRKIWRCYEPYFFERTMDALVSLYERAFVYERCIFQQNLPILTMEELEITENWIVELLSHPLVLEDNGFVDSTGSLQSATPVAEALIMKSEHVQNASEPTERVQSSTEQARKGIDNEGKPAVKAENTQRTAVKIDFVRNIPDNSVREHDCRYGSFEIIGRDCEEEQEEDDSGSSGSSEWHTAEYDEAEFVKCAKLVTRRNQDTLDRQKKGQRQVSLVLPDDDCETFENEVLEKISVENIDLSGSGAGTVQSDVDPRKDSPGCGSRESVASETKSIDANHNESFSSTENTPRHPQNTLYPDNDSLYSQESDTSSHNFSTDTPLMSSDEVFLPSPNAPSQSIWIANRPWSYTKSDIDCQLQVQPAHQLRRQNKNFVENFRQTCGCIDQILRQTSLMRKLQWVTKCLQQMNSSVREIFNQKSPDKPQIKALTGDDMPTILIVLLLHIDPKIISSLLPQLHLMYDLIAPFLENGCHGCSLTQFQVAIEFLLNKMKQNLKFYHNIAYSSSV